MYKHPLLDRDNMTPQEAFDVLIEGNHRFVNNLTENKDSHNFLMMNKEPVLNVLLRQEEAFWRHMRLQMLNGTGHGIID